MSLRKAVLVAQDAAPSGCFKRLEPVLKEKGFDTVLMIGEGKSTMLADEMQDKIYEEATNANIVVLGMSSSQELAKPEITAGDAAQSFSVPYGFYGDVPNCWGRARAGSWFDFLAPDTSFYFGINQKDADEAEQIFPRAKCITTGNPLREEMAFPRFTREEVRTKLGIAPDEKLVLAPGDKFAAGNMATWSTAIDALTLLQRNGEKIQLVLATHPGDRTPQTLYEELVSFSPIPTRIITKDILSSSDLVPGADIIIGSGGSICIEGAYQQIPLICSCSEAMLKRIESINGSRKIEAVENAIAEFINSAEDLASWITALTTNTLGRKIMRQRQRKLYPKPTERGVALRKMADAIDAIVEVWGQK